MSEQEVLARLRRLEDERDVAQLVASYGPLVDAGDADGVAALWEPEGRYDVDELDMRGRDAVRAMVRSAPHQGFVTAGCAHVQGPPRVVVDGDAAHAVNYSLMVVHEDGQFRIRRATANHWVLRRADGRWLVATRTSRLLDGGEEARAVLGGVPPAVP